MRYVESKGSDRHVAYFIYYDTLETLGPYLYGINMWHERGYAVSVCSLTEEESYRALPEHFRSSFRHYSVAIPPWLKIGSIGVQAAGFLARKLFGLNTPAGEWAKLLKMGYFAFRCCRSGGKERATVLIGTDPPGLWAAAWISKKYCTPYVYFVKEMFLSGDAHNLFDKIVKRLERRANKGALYTVEFDETRAELLRNDNGLASASMLAVPNAPMGKPNPGRGRYLRDKFNIPDDKKIVLYTGGIADYNLTYEHIASVATWPDNVVLVMHTKGAPRELDQLKAAAGKVPREIYFSTELLPFDQIDTVYSSCDIGLAIYGAQTLNHRYAGLSSGKMFNFMKACVPVITNDTPSCRKAIAETGCGICIGHISELGNAIGKILQEEEAFRSNCLKAFPGFSYDVNHGRFMDAVEAAVRGTCKHGA